MKLKTSIKQRIRKITGRKESETHIPVVKKSKKPVIDMKNQTKINQFLLQIQTTEEKSTNQVIASEYQRKLAASASCLFNIRKEKIVGADPPNLFSNFQTKPHAHGVKDIFKSLKNLRSKSNLKSKSNIKGRSYKYLPNTKQPKAEMILPDPSSAKASVVNFIPQKSRTTTCTKTREEMDNSLLSSRNYTLSTLPCPETTLFGHLEFNNIDLSADLSFPKFSSTPLTSKIGTPRFSSTPTSTQNTSLISRISHVADTSNNRYTDIFASMNDFERVDSIRKKLDPHFVNSSNPLWRPWL